MQFERYPAGLRWIAGIWLLAGLAMALVDIAPDVVLTLVFLAIGVVGTGARFRVRIDVSRRRISNAVGVFVPFWTVRVTPFHELRWVAFRLVITSVDNSASASYRIYAVGSSTEHELTTADDLIEARNTAEAVATLLDVGVWDEVTRSGYREPGSLDQTLRERLLRAEALPELGPPPPRLTLLPSGGELCVALPPARLLEQLGLAAAWCTFGVIGLLPFGIRALGLTHPSLTRDLSEFQGGTNAVPFLLLNGVTAGGIGLALIALVVVYRELAGAELRSIVYVSPAGLRVEIEGPVGRRTLRLGADTLESIGVARRTKLAWFVKLGPERIVASDDRAVVAFGMGCSSEEREWMIRAIWYGLLGRRHPHSN